MTPGRVNLPSARHINKVADLEIPIQARNIVVRSRELLNLLSGSQRFKRVPFSRIVVLVVEYKFGVFQQIIIIIIIIIIIYSKKRFILIRLNIFCNSFSLCTLMKRTRLKL